MLLAYVALSLGSDPVQLARTYDGRVGRVVIYKMRMGDEFEGKVIGTRCTIEVRDERDRDESYVNVSIRPEDAHGNSFTFSPGNDRAARSDDGSVTVVRNNDSRYVGFSGCGEGFMHLRRGPKTFEQKLMLKRDSVEYVWVYTCKPKSDEKGTVGPGPFYERIACEF